MFSGWKRSDSGQQQQLQQQHQQQQQQRRIWRLLPCRVRLVGSGPWMGSWTCFASRKRWRRRRWWRWQVKVVWQLAKIEWTMADGSSAPTWRKISLPLPHLLPNFGASNASSAGQKRKTGRDWSLRRQKTYDSPGCVSAVKKDDSTAVFSLSFKKVFRALPSFYPTITFYPLL